MTAARLNELLKNKKQALKMPGLFIGHGPQMNAIQEKKITRALCNVAKKFSFQQQSFVCPPSG